MHDKPSQKPPTLFTRTFPGSADVTNTEQLMEDYHREFSGASTVASTVRLPGKLADRQTQIKGLTHHPNMSIGTASQATNHTANTNESGIYRFGRSIAASFNPFNIWGKVKSGKRNVDESSEEATARHIREVQLDDQKRRAEEAYARMKAEGQFAGPGSKALKSAKSIVDFANNNGYNRDSGIAMGDSDEASTKPTFSEAPMGSIRKHFRQGSFNSVKKVRSEFHLTKRPSNAYLSADDGAEDPTLSLRKSQSKKDLQKQLKLTKRVSDLESKLESAKRQLDDTLRGAPPVPAIPRDITSNVSPSPDRSSTTRSRGAAALKRAFQPLPSLPSERLLLAGQDQMSVDQFNGTHLEKDLPAVPDEEWKFVSTKGHVAFSDVEMASPIAQRLDTSPTRSEAGELGTISKSGEDVLAAQSQFPVRSSSLEANVQTPQKAVPTPKKKPASKKRKSGGDDLRYMPASDYDDDAEWGEAAGAPKKKKASPKGKSTSPTNKTKSATKKLAFEDTQAKKDAGLESLKGKTKATTHKLAFEDAQAKRSANLETSTPLVNIFEPQPTTQVSQTFASAFAPQHDPSSSSEEPALASSSSPLCSVRPPELDMSLHPIDELSSSEANNQSGETPAPSLAAPAAAGTGLTARTSKVRLADEPDRATATATPSHPKGAAAYATVGRMSGIRNLGPTKRDVDGDSHMVRTSPVRLQKSGRAAIPEQWRSSSSPVKVPSPPPVPTGGKGLAVVDLGDEDEDEVMLVEGSENVAPLPSMMTPTKRREGRKVGMESFEWPEDCF